MSRQPRKVFGFTGAAKYGPLAAEGDEKPPEAVGDMSRKENKNSSSDSNWVYRNCCHPETGCLCCIVGAVTSCLSCKC